MGTLTSFLVWRLVNFNWNFELEMNRLVWHYYISVISVIFKWLSMSFWRNDFPIKCLKPKLSDTDLSLILIFKHARCTWSHTGYADHVWNVSLAGCTKLVGAVYWRNFNGWLSEEIHRCQRKFNSSHFTPNSYHWLTYTLKHLLRNDSTSFMSLILICCMSYWANIRCFWLLYQFLHLWKTNSSLTYVIIPI